MRARPRSRMETPRAAPPAPGYSRSVSRSSGDSPRTVRADATFGDCDGPIPPDEPRTVLAGRYALTGAIGAGGSGTVWRALDRATGAAVAVKLIRTVSAAQAARARRETAALRLAQLDGVVRLLDDGVEDGQHVIVMQLVDGEPFPGTSSTSWEAIRPPLIGMLRAVAGLHALGIVHRDLKPDNVLVDAAGVVTVVDLGIARGGGIGPTVTIDGGVIGTPRYLAPEQATGRRVDARADLYAIGIMLYEALTDSLPYAEHEIRSLLAAKQSQRVASLELRDPTVPVGVAALVDRLLARDPANRPGSALEVLAALGGLAGPPRLPWLGPETPIEEAVARLRAGRPAWVEGPEGAGRTRLIEEVEARLARLGVRVLRAVPGARPLESLQAVVDGGAGLADAEARLRARLDAGDALLVDEPKRLDRWSRALLTRVGGAILFAEPGPDPVTLAPLTAIHLRPLFAGPDLLFHLREDGAAALEARTGGLPKRVAREIEAWLATGVARWEGERLSVDRLGLERATAGFISTPGVGSSLSLVPPLDDLLGWIALAGEVSMPVLYRATGLPTWELDVELEELREQGAVRSLPDGRVQATRGSDALLRWNEDELLSAHRALADALAPGSPGRMLHLIAADDGERLAVEALLLADQLLPAGFAARAVILLTLALGRLPVAAPPELATTLIDTLARAALMEGARSTLKATAADLERHGSPHARYLAVFLEAWAATESGDRAGAVALVRGLAPHPDEEIDAFRLLVQVREAVWRDPAEAAAMVAPPEGEMLDSFLGRRRREWLGHIRFFEGRPAEAAELHGAVADVEPVPLRRLSARINAGLALLFADALEAAEASFRMALVDATQLRTPRLEAYVWCGLRTVTYRLGTLDTGLPELRFALRCLDLPRVEAEVLMTDAAIALRSGDRTDARELARLAAAAWTRGGFERGAVLADAIGYAAGERSQAPETLASAAARGGPPLLEVQVAGLLAWGGWRVPEDIQVRIASIARSAPPCRQSVLDPQEALAYVRRAVWSS